jgi:hypothetical protein
MMANPDKAQQKAEKARRAALRSFAIQLGIMVATAGGKRERYEALADQCPAIEALLREQAEA